MLNHKFTLLLACASCAFAQVQSGRLVGTIYDQTHAAVAGATLTVTDVATNIAKRVTTDGAGDYVVTPLDPGTYSVSASAPGFQTTVRRGVELTVGLAARVDLELRIGDTTTEVSVTSEIPLLTTESGTLGQVISNTQIVELPLNGRSFTELARLTPGVNLLPPTGNTQLVRPENVNGNVISGVPGSQTTFLLDGVDVTEQHQGGTWIQTSVDALQEFNVQQNAFSAEFARAGGSFNITTKSGANRVFGNVFEFLRNDKLDSRNLFAPTRAILKRNQFGGTLGGPVEIPRLYNGKNKTFFFFSYEGQRLRSGQVFNSQVPSEAQRNGDFSGPGLNRIYDPLTTVPNPAGSGTVRTQFPGNVIPVSRLSAPALFFNKYIPLANAPGGNAIFTPSNAYNQDQWTIRGDQEITANHKAFVRVSIVRNSEDDPSAFPPLGSTHLSGPAHNIAAALTSNLRSNMIHEARVSFMYGEYRSTAYFQGQGVELNKRAGITGLEANQDPTIASLPAFSWSGYTGFSGNAGDGRPKWQNRWANEFNDNLTWIKGKHIVKVGGRIHYFKPLFTDSRTHNGAFNYTGISTENPQSQSNTGDAFADWMLGYPASVGRGNPATWWGGYGTYWHVFLQDDFKLSNRLTLNLGLRYEYNPWLKGYRGQVATFDPTKAKPIIVASDSGQIDLDAQPLAKVGYDLYKDLIQTSSQAGLPITITTQSKKNFAPRFGLAWRPFGDSTVIRGGYGIFYESEGTSGRLNFNFLPFSVTETVNADRDVVPTRTTSSFFLGAPFGSAVTAASWIPVPTQVREPYDQHWNFGVQQQLMQRLVVEVDYVGNKGSFLADTNNINFPAAGPGTVQTRRPYPRFGTIAYNTQDGSSTYDALQAKVERRLLSGLWVLAAYTFSKSITALATPAVGGNYGWEKALTSFDVPHNFDFSFGYELPFGKGKRFANRGGIEDTIIGGWQLQGITGFRSGVPYTPIISRDVANNGVGSQRPNRIGSGNLDNPTLNLYFDKAAFTLPANFTYGNSGGDILRRDYLGSFDFSIHKEFSVTERSRLQFRAEVFNLPNAAYFAAPNASVDVAAGGRVTATQNNPRQMQFGLKYKF
jgi:Carboxypeptidase regulatory-like domain